MIPGCEGVAISTQAKSCELDDAWQLLEENMSKEELQMLEMLAWDIDEYRTAYEVKIPGMSVKDKLKIVLQVKSKAKSILDHNKRSC